MTLEEVYAIPANGDGWRLLPNGKHLMVGVDIKSSASFDWAVVGAGAGLLNYPPTS